MLKLFWIGLGALLLSACSSNDKQPELKQHFEQVTFFDSSVFDLDLKEVLERDPMEVAIEFPSQFDLNNMPSRIEKWLSAVKEDGGNIRLVKNYTNEEVVATRGFLLDAVELVIKAYDSITEGNMYDAVEGYSSQVIYNSEGRVERILLEKL